MSDWDTASSKMDIAVDERLGDTISYSTDSGVTFTDLPGFVLFFTEGFGLNSLDSALGSRPRVKIRKDLIGEVNPRTHRLRHPRLGADTYRPGNDDPDDQGRYVIFDIQKVRV